MLAQLDAVEMRRPRLSEQEDQLMTGAIEAAHTAGRFVPNQQVQEFKRRLLGGRQDMKLMPPILKR